MTKSRLTKKLAKKRNEEIPIARFRDTIIVFNVETKSWYRVTDKRHREENYVSFNLEPKVAKLVYMDRGENQVNVRLNVQGGGWFEDSLQSLPTRTASGLDYFIADKIQKEYTKLEESLKRKYSPEEIIYMALPHLR